MKNVHASKRTRHVSQQTRIKLIPRCLFCWSRRVSFVEGSDDWGDYVAVKCCRCEAEGSHARLAIYEGGEITDAMRQEAADAWNAVWENVVEPPSMVVVDKDCKVISRRRRNTEVRRAPEVTALPPGHPFAGQVAREELELRVKRIAPPKGTNGHNGHHQNGSAV